MFCKIVPAACLVASASAFSMAPAITARTPALSSLSSSQNVGSVKSLTAHRAASFSVGRKLRQDRSAVGLKMAVTAAPSAPVPLTGNTLKAALKVCMHLDGRKPASHTGLSSINLSARLRLSAY
jgi:hypothetical protein